MFIGLSKEILPRISIGRDYYGYILPYCRNGSAKQHLIYSFV
jgi:hypothetical protein